MAFDIIFFLQKGVSTSALMKHCQIPDQDKPELYSLFSLLLMANIIEEINLPENEIMNQWEFH